MQPRMAHMAFSRSTYPWVMMRPDRQGPDASSRKMTGGARSFKNLSQLMRLRTEKINMLRILANFVQVG